MPRGQFGKQQGALCDNCGQPYQAKQDTQRFCRDACRAEWHRTQAQQGQLTLPVAGLDDSTPPKNCPTCGQRWKAPRTNTDAAGVRDTSRWTFDRIKASRSRFYRQIAVVLSRAPATDEELEAGTDCAPNGVRARRGEMQKAGLVQRTGDKRPGKSGFLADIWMLTDLGWTYWRGSAA